tara:strand:- start:1214 stop:1501 length:288 start_codon:yes stop_codon:yes gene_type:complete
MNGRVSKIIKKRAIGIQLEWVHSLLNAEEAQKVTHSNLQQMLPKQTHIWAHRQCYNSSYSLRQVMRVIKKLHRWNPKRDIWGIKLKDIQDVIEIK